MTVLLRCHEGISAFGTNSSLQIQQHVTVLNVLPLLSGALFLSTLFPEFRYGVNLSAPESFQADNALCGNLLVMF